MFQFSKKLTVAFALIATLLIVASVQAIDFEDGSVDAWEFVDEDVSNLGDVGPSTWEIRDSQIGLDGKVLFQGSNIWGSPPDSSLMGTFAIYKGEKFTNFVLEVDVAAADNDGMGIVWAYDSTAQHYSAIMINDNWPDPDPVDGIGGPFLKIKKRISDAEPWYETLEAIKGRDGGPYVPYAESVRLHWTLTVIDGSFAFEREDGLSIKAEDHDYSGGYVGIQLYAQQAEFDNFKVSPITAVQPADKVASVWGEIKQER